MTSLSYALAYALYGALGIIDRNVNEIDLESSPLGCFMSARTPDSANVVSMAKSIPFVKALVPPLKSESARGQSGASRIAGCDLCRDCIRVEETIFARKCKGIE
jgi:hypothetical protein